MIWSKRFTVAWKKPTNWDHRNKNQLSWFENLSVSEMTFTVIIFCRIEDWKLANEDHRYTALVQLNNWKSFTKRVWNYKPKENSAESFTVRKLMKLSANWMNWSKISLRKIMGNEEVDCLTKLFLNLMFKAETSHSLVIKKFPPLSKHAKHAPTNIELAATAQNTRNNLDRIIDERIICIVFWNCISNIRSLTPKWTKNEKWPLQNFWSYKIKPLKKMTISSMFTGCLEMKSV